jgi:N-acetylglucosamine kinase-like BadF-type ATPase
MFVGIDAGGSGTRAALATVDGALQAVGFGGPSNSLTGEAGRRRLEEALHAALAPVAQRVGTGKCVVHGGVRSLSVPGKEEAFRAAVRQILPGAEVRVSNDARIALCGALGGSEGVAVLAGTGSIAMARAADGREARAGGLGYLLGDEGSAFWLGREAVRAALSGAQCPLRDRLTRAAGTDDLLGWVYAPGTPVQRLAELAPLVAEAAVAGDALATTLLRRAGEELAALAQGAATALWGRALPAAVRVAPCGGVWRAGAALIEPFEMALQQLAPGARVVQPRLPPVGGALLLAMGSPDAATIARLSEEMGMHGR